jgi:prophage regulatory protein
MGATLITIAEVAGRVSLSRSEIYRRMKLGVFPQRVRLGPKRIAFLESEIDAWMEERIQARGNAVANLAAPPLTEVPRDV